MAKKQPVNESIITTPLVVAMATLMLVLAGFVSMTADQLKKPSQVEIKATSPDQKLLSEEDSIEALRNDLKVMEMDDIDSELQTLQNLE